LWPPTAALLYFEIVAKLTNNTFKKLNAAAGYGTKRCIFKKAGLKVLNVLDID